MKFKSENILRLIEPELLIPTVEVLEEPLLRHAFKNILRYNGLYPPIVITPVHSKTSHLGRRKFFIILDGNHRACKCALYDSPIKAINITKDSDKDIILELELRRLLPGFPHRRFLRGEQTLKTLVDEAIEAASKINCTVMEMAQKIKPQAKLHGKSSPRPQSMSEDKQKLIQTSAQNTHSKKIVGIWLDETPFAEGQTTIWIEKGTIIMLQEFKDGNSRMLEMSESIQSGQRKYTQIGKNPFEEYYVIDHSGNLRVYDCQGLVRSLRPIR